MDKPIIIFGAKGIASAALEIFQSNNITVYGFLDDDTSTHGTEINDIPVLGDSEDHGYLKLIGQKCEAFVATDENKLRKEVVKYIMDKRKVMPTNAIHGHATISSSASIGHGNFINAGAILSADVEVGHHSIIHSGAILESGVKVADFVQVGAGTIINSGVTVEEGAFIGSGANIVGGVTIGKGARIGAGSVVIQTVKKSETVFGNPAVAVKK
ncbi:MAG: acetyltransferase [Cytophagales bacterium]|nr:acetyltransferase [Cytophagales bacterium]